jgi:hypothetical protein
MIAFASPPVLVDVLEGIRDVNAPRTSDPSAEPYGRSCWAAAWLARCFSRKPPPSERALRPGEPLIVVVGVASDFGGETADGRGCAGPREHRCGEASVRGVQLLRRRTKRGAKRLVAETTNGDSPGCTSSNPSPERFDEALCEESPLEKSITGPEK